MAPCIELRNSDQFFYFVVIKAVLHCNLCKYFLKCVFISKFKLNCWSLCISADHKECVLIPNNKRAAMLLVQMVFLGHKMKSKKELRNLKPPWEKYCSICIQ